MIDPKSVVTQVKQDIYPSDWHVYRVLRGKYGTTIAVFWICAAFAGLICLASWSVSIAQAIIFLCLVTVFVCMALVFMRKAAASVQSSILAILPVEVVQYDADDPANIGWLYFPNIARIELAQQTEIVGFDGDINSRTYYWLDVYCRDGTYLKWSVNKCFGDTASIGKTIIAAYNYHWHQKSLFPL